MSRRRRGRPRSRIAASVNAIRRARRRHTHRVTGTPGVKASVGLAVREANPRTLSGLAAQGTALGVMDHRGRLVPVVALAGLLPCEALWPGATCTGLGVAGAAGLAAHWRQGEYGTGGWRGRPLGLAAGAGGQIAFTAAWHLGLLGGLPLWQEAAVLVASWAPGAIAWWRPPRPPAPAAITAGDQITLPAEMDVLRGVLAEAIGIEKSPIAGARIAALDHPAPQVATAVVNLAGTHTNRLPIPALRDGLEALADQAGQTHPSLGRLQPGTVEITPTGVSQIQITMSWSRELTEQVLAWNPPADLAPGTVWLGQVEDRSDVLVPGWTRGADGRVSCHHVKVIGATGSGKSVTIRALLIGGLSTATELVIPLDGKGDSLDELAALVPGQRIARDADSWQAGIALFGAIFLSRKQRQGGPDAWREPRPGDPLITLQIDEAAVVRAGLAPEHHAIVGMGARQTRSLGMRTIQSSQVPLVDEWVGGGGWRSQASVTLLHALRDETHARIAAQGLDQALDLTRMPRHFAAVALDAHVLAARTRVALITADDVRSITQRPQLHPLDQAVADGAWDAYVQAVAAGSPGAGDTDPLTETLVALGTPGFTLPATPQVITTTTTAATSATPTGQAPTPARAEVIDITRGRTPAAPGAGSLKQTILQRLITTSDRPTRPELVNYLKANGWSHSGAHKAIGQMLADGALTEQAGRLIPAILAS